MQNIISRLLDRAKASQRTRQLFINVGLFLLSGIAFYTANPLFELGPVWVKWISVLAFLGNALAGITAVPNRSIPVGYELVSTDMGDRVHHHIVKKRSTNWLNMLLNSMKATDQFKSILVNVGLLIGALIALFVAEDILPANLPQWVATIGFAGNALAAMLNRPERSVPNGYELYQRPDKSYYISEIAVNQTEQTIRKMYSSRNHVKVEF